MDVLQFPFPDDSAYFEQPWTLDGVQYLFTVQWNTRESVWYCRISDATAKPILSGFALRTSRNLLAQYPTLPLPRGLLFVYDTTGVGTDAGLNSFATTHQLLYAST